MLKHTWIELLQIKFRPGMSKVLPDKANLLFIIFHLEYQEEQFLNGY